MASITGFSFYDDPANHTNPTSVTIDPVAQAITAPGLAIPFAKCDELSESIKALANQDTSDGVVETSKTVYKDDGSPLCVLNATVANGTPPTVTHVQAGVTYGKTKALDFAAGIDHYVLGL